MGCCQVRAVQMHPRDNGMAMKDCPATRSRTLLSTSVGEHQRLRSRGRGRGEGLPATGADGARSWLSLPSAQPSGWLEASSCQGLGL